MEYPNEPYLDLMTDSRAEVMMGCLMVQLMRDMIWPLKKE